MNNQEAIEILQTKYHIEGPVKFVCDELESREIAIKALEKQVSKKTIDNGYNVFFCPVCGGSVWQIRCESNYCFRCGQKIDWEVEIK